MFPDTSNFTDPAYTDLPPDELGIPNLPSGIPMYAPPLGTANQGPAAPVSGQPGSALLGWLGLAMNIAQTSITAARGGQVVTARPGTLATPTAKKAWVTLAVVIALFAGAIFVLRK